MELPEPTARRYWSSGHRSRWQLAGEHAPPDAEPLFTADQLRAYAEEAVKQEREAILAAIDDIEEKPWFGYENPNTFQDAKWAAEAVVRARSELGESSTDG